MQSYQISLTPHERDAGRFIATVRRALQRALAEERAEHGITQASIAETLGINRSVIHRQIMGMEDISLGRVGAIASLLGRAITFSLDRPELAANTAHGSNSQIVVDRAAAPSPVSNAANIMLAPNRAISPSGTNEALVSL